MVKFILSSLLLLLLLGTVSSDSGTLKVVAGNEGYKVSNKLRGYYSQQDSQDGGYHKAEVYFKTKVPSLNPDQAGVSMIDCKDDKITLNFNNNEAIKQINDWPDKVMLLISHQWECFGKSTTQFFMIKDKTVDSNNKKVTFTVKECDIAEWAEDFLLDVSWDEGKNITRDSLDKHLHFPPINAKKTISLNALYNGATGKTSKPNIPIVGNKLICANCFTNGEATIGLQVAGKFSIRHFKLIITDASITLNGNINLNLDFTANLAVGDAIKKSLQILNIPIPPGIGVPRIFNIGPSILLVASTELRSSAGASVNFGGEVSLPNFYAQASFIGGPHFQHSGFKPVAKSHGLTVNGVDTSADIINSLKPRLAFGINILNGKFSQQVGFEIVTSLEANISVGNNNKCKSTQPRLEVTLDGDLGFFAVNKDITILKFPENVLLDKCS